MVDKLVFRRKHFDKLMLHLYADTSREAMALGYYCVASNDRGQRILVQDVELPSEVDYEVKTSTRVSLSPQFLERSFKRCENEHVHLLDIHTHPWAEGVEFSPVDDYEARNVKGPYLKSHVPDVSITYILFGAKSTDARVRIWDHDLGDFHWATLLIIL